MKSFVKFVIFCIFQDPSCVTDNASSNVLVLEDEVYVTSETCFLRRINPTTLETKEKVRNSSKYYRVLRIFNK